MRLYLLRHGIADHPGWSAPDSERPLNGEGIESLQKYGKRLTKWGVEPGLILHSPYTRAKQTALIVAQGIDAVSKLREDARIAPGFDLDLLGRSSRRTPRPQSSCWWATIPTSRKWRAR